MNDVTSSEYAVVGGLCIEPSIVDKLALFLVPEDFTLESCAAVYTAALADRQTFDAVYASNLLAATMGADRAAAFVRECMDLCPSVRAVPGHARAVHEAARMRRLREAVHDALAEAADGSALAERLAGLGRDYLAAETTTAHTMTTALCDVICGAEHGQERRVDTGFLRLDRLVKGLYPGQLVIAGARPGVGKSAFALNLALNVARSVGKVVLFSLEMTAQEVAERGIVNYSSLPLDAFLDGPLDEKKMKQAIEAGGELSRLPIVIDDTPALTMAKLRARVRLHPDVKLVIVDYLGLMATDRKDRNRNLELGELARSLKNFAGEADVPIIALSQLNRGTSDTERPGLRSLRDSGELEQHSSKVLLMWKTEDGLTAVDVAKNRRGRTGVVQFEFDGAHMRFTESCIAYSPPPQKPRRGFMEAGA